MKNCSYCGLANQDEAVACTDCGTKFEGPPEPQPVAADLVDPALSLVVVRTFSNVVEAGVLKARLEASGIESCIPEEYTPQIFWSVVPSPIERVTVRVAARDYEAARAIVADDDTRTRTETQTPAPAQPAPEPSLQESKRCVACGAAIPVAAELCPKCSWTQPPTI